MYLFSPPPSCSPFQSGYVQTTNCKKTLQFSTIVEGGRREKRNRKSQKYIKCLKLLFDLKCHLGLHTWNQHKWEKRGGGKHLLLVEQSFLCTSPIKREKLELLSVLFLNQGVSSFCEFPVSFPPVTDDGWPSLPHDTNFFSYLLQLFLCVLPYPPPPLPPRHQRVLEINFVHFTFPWGIILKFSLKFFSYSSTQRWVFNFCYRRSVRIIITIHRLSQTAIVASA